MFEFFLNMSFFRKIWVTCLLLWFTIWIILYYMLFNFRDYRDTNSFQYLLYEFIGRFSNFLHSVLVPLGIVMYILDTAPPTGDKTITPITKRKPTT